MKTILLKNANILNGTLNMKVQENIDILINGQKIIKIEKNIQDKADKTIDLSGKYVVPGLINMHVHLPASGKIGKKKAADQKKLISFICSTALTRRIGMELGAKYAKMELQSGVTSLRAVGGVSNFDSRLAKLIESGKKTGPRILAADNAIGVPGGHMDGTVAKAASSVEEAVKLVEEVKNNGSHLIKLMITGGILDCKHRGHPGDLKMPAEMVKACCDKAHELGLKVAAHVEGPEGIKIAIENGVDTIEHGADVDEELVLALKERNGALICTLSPALPLATLNPKELNATDDMQFNSQVLVEGMINVTEKCLKNSVLVGLGTDTGCPLVTHYDMWRELVYFAKKVNGVDNNFALHTATEVNATIAGISDVTGTVEINKDADLLIVDKNPLDDLTSLRNPTLVIARGKIVTKRNKKYADIEAKLDTIL